VVVRFSRARKRYERQGLLVEEVALERAERECLEDAEARALRREREAERRALLDVEYVEEFARRLKSRYPSCPAGEAEAIAERACEKYSGRVGRTAAAKRFGADAIDLAVIAHIRHTHTGYDNMLARGWERSEARHTVATAVSETLEKWRS